MQTLARVALCLALSAPAAADQAWVEVKSPNFTVYGDAGERAAQRTATRFEEMRAFMQQQWPWARRAPGEPIVIVALRNERAMAAFYAEPWRRKGARHPAGFAMRAPGRTFVVPRASTLTTSSASWPWTRVATPLSPARRASWLRPAS